MSIYATLWCLKFPRYGQDHIGCEWIEIVAQGVPAHIGSAVLDSGYADGDPYADFLPPAITVRPDDEERAMRAVVIVKAGTPKGTTRSGQEYVNTLLILTGQQYATIPFQTLYERICDVLRREGPQCRRAKFLPDGKVQLLFDDGSTREVTVE